MHCYNCFFFSFFKTSVEHLLNPSLRGTQCTNSFKKRREGEAPKWQSTARKREANSVGVHSKETSFDSLKNAISIGTLFPPLLSPILPHGHEAITPSPKGRSDRMCNVTAYNYVWSLEYGVPSSGPSYKVRAYNYVLKKEAFFKSCKLGVVLVPLIPRNGATCAGFCQTLPVLMQLV